MRIVLLFIIINSGILAPPQVSAFVSMAELKGPEVGKWLSSNEIRVRTEEVGTSLKIIVSCPNLTIKEYQWGLSLHLKQKDTVIANVVLHPGVLSEIERKILKEPLSFQFTISKSLVNDSSIEMYVEEKSPRDPWSGPHRYFAINLKELIEAHAHD